MGQAEGFPDFVSAVKRTNVRKVVTFAGNYITSLYGFVTIFAGDKPPAGRRIPDKTSTSCFAPALSLPEVECKIYYSYVES